jgi:segregation and condensation protein A
MSTNFSIKMGEFEGPLDLLLSLIEKHKMHINDVSLAQVTDEYISFIRSGQNISVENMANFILVASTLILIKSYSLISTLAITSEEKENIEDLEKRLKLYQRVKELTIFVKELFGKKIIFQREATSRGYDPIFVPTKEINLANLQAALQTVIANLPKKEKLPQVIVKKVMSLEEVIGNLTGRIQKAFKMKFSDYVKESKHERVNIIVSFLGMLELVKQGIIDVKQDLNFSEIEMETKEVGVPHY